MTDTAAPILISDLLLPVDPDECPPDTPWWQCKCTGERATVSNRVPLPRGVSVVEAEPDHAPIGNAPHDPPSPSMREQIRIAPDLYQRIIDSEIRIAQLELAVTRLRHALEQ